MTEQRADYNAGDRFIGFIRPEQNWFRLPNNWTNLTARMRTWSEHKVVEYIIRHTWGYQEYDISKRITLEEFENGRKRKDGTRIDVGVGLSRPSIVKGLKQAVEDGFIIEEIDDSDKARIEKCYRPRMVGDPTQRLKNFTPEVKDLYPRGKRSLPRSEKETLERNPGKMDSPPAKDFPDLAIETARHQPNNVARQMTDRFHELAMGGPMSDADPLVKTWTEQHQIILNRAGQAHKHLDIDTILCCIDDLFKDFDAYTWPDADGGYGRQLNRRLRQAMSGRGRRGRRSTAEQEQLRRLHQATLEALGGEG